MKTLKLGIAAKGTYAYDAGKCTRSIQSGCPGGHLAV